MVVRQRRDDDGCTVKQNNNEDQDPPKSGKVEIMASPHARINFNISKKSCLIRQPSSFTIYWALGSVGRAPA